jgi:CelD/BcsL family acetyltransferase involved in cellulose biosynthesis
VTITLELVAGRDRRVEPIWHVLERTAPVYFLSWGWIATWLAMLPADQVPELAVVRDGERPISACFLARHRTMRHHVMPMRARFLNSTGVARYDELCIEHNAVLGVDALGALLELLPHDWDELVVSGLDREALATVPEPWRVCIDGEVAAPFVDLERVRRAPDGYVSLLGRSTRSQLRRARRDAGELTVEHATSLDQALSIYDELVALHTASWYERGDAGAFADPWFDAFHRRLIVDRFATGELELVRVRARDHTVGCLYNLVWRGRVVFYQSGLAAAAGAHDKPGYLCHAAAIEAAAAAGHITYDFLAGDGRYKRNLATDQGLLVWARIQRPLVRFAVEDGLRALRRLARRTVDRSPDELRGLTARPQVASSHEVLGSRPGVGHLRMR